MDYRRSAKVRCEEDSILEMENRLGSVELGESDIGYPHLYPNRWVFSIKIQDSENLVIY